MWKSEINQQTCISNWSSSYRAVPIHHSWWSYNSSTCTVNAVGDAINYRENSHCPKAPKRWRISFFPLCQLFSHTIRPLPLCVCVCVSLHSSLCQPLIMHHPLSRPGLMWPYVYFIVVRDETSAASHSLQEAVSAAIQWTHVRAHVCRTHTLPRLINHAAKRFGPRSLEQMTVNKAMQV